MTPAHPCLPHKPHHSSASSHLFTPVPAAKHPMPATPPVPPHHLVRPRSSRTATSDRRRLSDRRRPLCQHVQPARVARLQRRAVCEQEPACRLGSGSARCGGRPSGAGPFPESQWLTSGPGGQSRRAGRTANGGANTDEGSDSDTD